MVAKSRTPAPSRGLPRIWEKYGAWIVTLLAAVVIAWLAVTLIGRHRQSQREELRQRLTVINNRLLNAEIQLRIRLQLLGLEDVEIIKTVAAETEQQLRQLLVDCEYPDVRSKINLSLAQALLKQENYAEAEQVFQELSENESLGRLDRALVNLGLAYAAQGMDDLTEARVRWKRVLDDHLYKVEAMQNIGLIDEVLARRERRKTHETKPDADEKTD